MTVHMLRIFRVIAEDAKQRFFCVDPAKPGPGQILSAPDARKWYNVLRGGTQCNPVRNSSRFFLK